MQRIASLLRKDVRYASQENILTYMFVVPIVFAILLRVFLPAVEGMEMTYAVDRSVPTSTISALEEYGRVQVFESYDKLEERVLRFDDVAGITYRDGTYRLVLEGNEDPQVRALAGVIIDNIAHGRELVDIEVSPIGTAKSLAKEFGAAIIALIAVFIGGLAAGMSIVDDRESRTLRALAVSPMTTIEYLLTKAAFAAIVVFVTVPIAASIVVSPMNVDFPRLLATALSLLGMSLLFGFLVARFSSDQFTAIVAVKSLMMPFMGLPLLSFIIPTRLKWLLYPFPNYWAFESLMRLMINKNAGILIPNLLAAGISLVALALLLPGMSKSFRLGLVSVGHGDIKHKAAAG